MVNVVDLMRLVPPSEHPHGLPEDEFDGLFPVGTPVIFAYHGYPSLIHQLTYKRANHDNFHVHGYRDEGTTTTPFDMVMLNDLDRFRLVVDVIDRVPGLADDAGDVRDAHARTARRSPGVDPCDGRRHPERARLDLAGLMPAGEAMLVVNAGSTSTKLSIVGDDDMVPWSFTSEPGEEAMERALDGAGAALDSVGAVGHRIVHGGAKFVEPVVIDATVVDEIDALAELAPLHNEPGLAGIRVARAKLPDVAQVACFDTAFHATMPDSARAYGGPYEWLDAGLRRYGFHGLSHEYATARERRAARSFRPTTSGWSRATSEEGARSPRSTAVAASTPPWASRRSMGS